MRRAAIVPRRRRYHRRDTLANTQEAALPGLRTLRIGASRRSSLVIHRELRRKGLRYECGEAALFSAQRDHRIDARCAARGEIRS
jgi:hypothetical protein